MAVVVALPLLVRHGDGRGQKYIRDSGRAGNDREGNDRRGSRIHGRGD